MNIRQHDYGHDEAAAPVDMLAALSDARGWQYDFISDHEITLKIGGSWTEYLLRGIWREEDNVLQLLCLPDIRISGDKKATMLELTAMVNEQLWLGHFDIWSSSNVLLYRHGIMLGEEGLLSLAQAQFVVENAVSECDRFYPAFQFVLWGDKNAGDALAGALVDAAGEA